MKKRLYYQNIWKDFKIRKHLIFIVGPRQTGKTTLANLIAENESSCLYYNYDIPEDKVKIIKDPYFFEEVNRKKGQLPLIIFDEIHKYKEWKNYIKGIYDGFHTLYHFLITGSGRLDLYLRGSDSLAGRYWQFHLFPFTLGEIVAQKLEPLNNSKSLTELTEEKKEYRDIWNNLFELSGFPEPFLSGKKIIYNRWINNYHRQLIYEDIRNSMAIKQISLLETLFFLLVNQVGKGFSANSMANSLKVSHNTITSWINIFERFFLIFKIKPYSKKIPRSIELEPKVYLYNYAFIKEAGPRFENMVALELKRAVTLWKDYGYGDYDLCYIRNREKQEIDFVITLDNQPYCLIETKLNETNISSHIYNFQSILNIPFIQLVNKSGINQIRKNGKNLIYITSAWNWLERLH